LSAAPLFEERLALNAAAVAQGKPLVDCAMYELEGQLTTVLPGRSPCLACLCPAPPPGWQRRCPPCRGGGGGGAGARGRGGRSWVWRAWASRSRAGCCCATCAT